MRILFLSLPIVILVCVSRVFAQSAPAPLIIISLDGMRPDYVTHADEHGLKIPTLRSFLTQGSYAEGVTGVIPTVTYPSHTTIVTGVSPAEHGVYGNAVFDPQREHPGLWYWFFKDIKVETLYQAAAKAGLKTASVSWPVTVGAPIDYNIAEYFQTPPSDLPQDSLYRPVDILAQFGITRTSGRIPDVLITDEAIDILKKFRPSLMLVHLVDLDHSEHSHGPFSAEANAQLEVLDGQVNQIQQAALGVNPATRIAIVSDHGFFRIGHEVNLNVLLAQAGLIQIGAAQPGSKEPVVSAWNAQIEGGGGTCAVNLNNPEDSIALDKVRVLLDKAKDNPAYGIETVLTRDQITKGGGFPNAALLVDFREGYSCGGSLTGAVVVDSSVKGTHGFLPSRPGMLAAFMIKGKGIAQGRNLHIIDMRQLAPTFAQLLDIHLPAARLAPVNIKPWRAW